MTTWEKVYFQQHSKEVMLGGGKEFYVSRPSNRRFLYKAAEKAWAYMKDEQLLLFYNSETGDICIPGSRTPEEINQIKGEFLYFISNDSHEETEDWRVVEVM